MQCRMKRGVVWSWIPIAVMVAVDVLLRLLTTTTEHPRAWFGKEWLVYSVGVLWAGWSWLRVGRWLQLYRLRQPDRIRLKVVVGLTTLFFSTLITTSWIYRGFMGQSPSWQAIQFLVREPRHTVELAKAFGGLPQLLALTAVASFVGFVLWKRALSGPPQSRPGWRRGLDCTGLLIVTSLVALVPGMQSPLPVEANTWAAAAQFGLAKITTERHLVSPIRPPMQAQSTERRPNVLLLLGESLSADAVFPQVDLARNIDAKTWAPFQSQLPQRRAEGYFPMFRGRANSTATESSVPTILSGVDLSGASEAYGTVESIWSLGKSVGASTFLFAAPGYNWSHFDEYFLDKNVDVAKTGLDFAESYSNDTGVDDGVVVQVAIEHLRQLAKQDKPFVGVIHFNATHIPGFAGPGVKLPKSGSSRERATAASRYVDRLHEKLVKELQSLGVLENTLLLATADHGEYIFPQESQSRLGNFHDYILRVPYWLRVPVTGLDAHPGWSAALDGWRDRNVQNMDILPTVVQWLRIEGGPAFAGRSLFGAPPSRPVALRGQSTCAFRQWGEDGFYVVDDQLKFIAETRSGQPLLFDLATDPGEQKNIWSDAKRRVPMVAHIRRLVNEGEELGRLCERLGELCPVVGSPAAP